MYEYYKFDLIPLRYSYDALEPHINAVTMMLHHDKHLAAHVNSLNAILARYPQYQKWPLEKLIKNYRTLPSDIQNTVKNSACGVYNHNLFFNIMGPSETEAAALHSAIKQAFGSIEEFKAKFKESAMKVFGSGYTWLALNSLGQLSIVNSQDCILYQNLFPVLLIDLWEHAYYLQYQNRKADYIDNWFRTVNWPSAQAYYNYYILHNH